MITEKKSHANRRHNRTRFDRVKVSGVSQNALKQSPSGDGTHCQNDGRLKVDRKLLK